MTQKSLDYSAFTHQFTNEEVFERLKQNQFGFGDMGIVIKVLIAIAAIPAILALTTLFLSTTLLLLRLHVILGALPFLFVTGVGYVVWLAAKRWAIQKMRYQLFASSNGMRVLGTGTEGHTGLIFQEGYAHRFDTAFASTGPKSISFGNFKWDTGQGRSRMVHTRGFIRVPLSRSLPQVVLDATSNDLMKRFSSLPVSLKGSQRISLEGDFDKYFTVYCPANYGRDTLYWLTPELMEMMIQKLSGYDIETVDSYVNLYPSGAFKLDQPTIESIVKLADWVREEFEENTHRYSDERVGSFTANVVGEKGKRLKTGLTKTTIILTVIYILQLVLKIWFRK